MMSYTGMKMNDLHVCVATQMSPINIMVSGTLLYCVCKCPGTSGCWKQFTPGIGKQGCALCVENLKTIIKLTKSQFFFFIINMCCYLKHCKLSDTPSC